MVGGTAAGVAASSCEQMAPLQSACVLLWLAGRLTADACAACAPAGETNGKSNNLNNCLKNVIYKDYYPQNAQGPKIPTSEVRAVQTQQCWRPAAPVAVVCWSASYACAC
jgi:hypothetical protein